jgi:SAM-dependent methyltransferase
MQRERMDDPFLAGHLHRHALQGLSRLNLLSGSTGIVWSEIKDLTRGRERPLRILDLASGSGDIALGVWRRARRAGADVEILGVDASPMAARFANERAAKAGVPIRFSVLDVTLDPLPDGFDVVMCSLFLHHLDEEGATSLLTKMRTAAGRLVLVSDLVRSARGLALAGFASRLFTSSEVVHTDATRSVRAAFRPAELDMLARRAGMDGARIRRRWPFRMLLSWKPE